MINMMYLVLTAMLAMNVSKEVLDAFAVMDADLVRSERAHEQRSRVEYEAFAQAATQYPEKFGAAHAKAMRVKAQADSLVSHIEGIKLQATATADKLDPGLLQGRDADGRDTLRALIALESKEDRETLTRMLVGSEPGAPHQRPGGAFDLRMRIVAFRDSLKELASAKGPELAAALDMLFDFNDRRDASGTLNNWESANFYDVPLAAGIASLSKLQADIRSAENDLVKWLYRSVEQDDYKFGTLTTAVIPQSNLIMVGDSFRADVFLAAYDPRNPPEVIATGGNALPIGGDGKAKLRLRGDRIGEQLVEGVIRFEGPLGTEEIPYSTKYQVMAPLLVASPTKMNVLYRGVDNPIELSVPGVPADRITPVIDNGTISRSGNGWVVNKVGSGKAQLSAMVRNDDGSTRRIGPIIFRVKDLPPPMSIVAQKNARDSKVCLSAIQAAQGVLARLEDTDFEAPFKVTRFRFSLVRKGASPVEVEVLGNAFNEKVKEVLKAARVNDQIYFEEIRAKLTNGQGNEVSLPSIALKIQACQ